VYVDISIDQLEKKEESSYNLILGYIPPLTANWKTSPLPRSGLACWKIKRVSFEIFPISPQLLPRTIGKPLNGIRHFKRFHKGFKSLFMEQLKLEFEFSWGICLDRECTNSDFWFLCIWIRNIFGLKCQSEWTVPPEARR
jgi:hypothetical protein